MKIGSFKRTVAAAGTEVRLTTSSFHVKKVAIKALSTNTGLVGVGRTHSQGESVSSTDWFELSAKESLSLDPFDQNGSETNIDLYEIYLDSAVSDEGVCVIYGYDEKTDSEPGNPLA